ncbi:peptidase M4 [Streptomyces luomodiensis]|uniref:Peptidase M4 n=1 Tax=Streptomyces luomodiensis TaxID=3026192 RepID=A0ABY9V2F7_9ACTN|nr:PepSY domain-containing protein [Streptomyces sp. SCA4-21]WNE98933.1 peptidase M4 [Streptomyces sp. SCA4-21]
MKRNIVIASVAAAALLTGGTAFAVAGGGADRAPSSSAAAADAWAGGQSGDRADGASTTTRASFSDAAEAALKAVPGTLASLDLDHGQWEADVLGKDGAWHEVTLDASDAKVVDQRVDRDDNDAEDAAEDAAEAAALKKAAVSATEAARKAASHGTVTSVEFDGDRTAVWEVEVVKNHKEHDLTVGLQSGKVTQAPADDDHGDNDSDDHGDDD